MTTIEIKREDERLSRLLSECFSGGERLRPMGGDWYEISFQGAYRYYDN